jgi:hypothetical protein
MRVHSHVSFKQGAVSKSYKRTVVGRVAYKADGVMVTAAMRNDPARMSETFSQSDEEPTYTVRTNLTFQVNFVVFFVFDQEWNLLPVEPWTIIFWNV